MDTPPAPGPRQRSPWFYVLLGCVGLAVLLVAGCLASGLALGLGVKKAVEGETDPAARTRAAVEQLGAVPAGYSVLHTTSVFGLMKQVLLSDQPPLADGGLPTGGRLLAFLRIVANEQNKATRDFFEGRSEDATALQQGGVRLDTKAIIKRGQLKVDGRSVRYLVARPRGASSTPGLPEQLTNTFLFECPDEVLRVAVWSQPDPDPAKADDQLELAGTVGDEAELARLIKPVNPCGK